MAVKALFGEKATTKLAGLFDSQEQLESVSSELRRQANLQNTQLWVVRPHDSDFALKLEPEVKGVARTAIRAHLWMGLLGLIAGLVLWGVLYIFGVPAVVSSPYYSGAAIVAFATVAGLLVGGLVTARPDHQRVIQAVDSATKAGRWSLVVHPRDPEQCQQAERVFKAANVEMVRSLI